MIRTKLLQQILLDSLRQTLEYPIARLLAMLNTPDFGYVDYWGREFEYEEVYETLEEMKHERLVETGLSRGLVR